MFSVRDVARISLKKPGAVLTAMRTSTRGLAHLQDQMNYRGKVEEDRFMRARDDLYLKRTRTEHEHLRRMKQYDELIRPAMMDLHASLKKTGGPSSGHLLSARQLEALARWKLGLDPSA